LSDKPGYIVHIISGPDWEEALATGEYRPASFAREGFIHYSRPEQVLWVVNQFYSKAEDLMLLWIDPAQMNAPLRWEPVDDQVFPHGYGPLNLEAVVKISRLNPDEDGVYRQVETV
jgi:uncharacterized protein (DUF952 family)